MLLIHPPAVRPCEPPLSIARLAAHLRARGQSCSVLDLNLEADLALLKEPLPKRWQGRAALHAIKRREADLEALRSWKAYEVPARYERAVRGLESSLKAAGRAHALKRGRPLALPSLADYREEGRSPLMRADLLSAAANPADSPYAAFMAERVEPFLGKDGSRFVGISLGYLSQALPAFALIGIIRSIDPETRIVLGGALINSWLGCGSLGADEDFGGLVDAVLFGRGEDALDAYLGLQGSETGEPDFDGFPLDDYLSPLRILPFAFSSGCAWRRCRFCPERAEGHGYRCMRVDDALAQLDLMVERWRPGLIHFMDSEIPLSALRGLVRRPLSVPWYGFARFSPDVADPAFCRALARSGCLMLQLGLESADQAVLDANDKGTRLEHIQAALDALHGAGIGTYAYLLFGTPAEDRDAALRTRDFVAERIDTIDYLNLSIFNMPVRGPDAAELGDGAFYPGDLSLYTGFAHPRGWDRPSVRAFIQGEFQEDPRIRTVVARTPPVFTSNHAPCFILSRRPKPRA